MYHVHLKMHFFFFFSVILCFISLQKKFVMNNKQTPITPCFESHSVPYLGVLYLVKMNVMRYMYNLLKCT